MVGVGVLLKEFGQMDVSKQIFESFINRTIAYDFSTHAGEPIIRIHYI